MGINVNSNNVERQLVRADRAPDFEYVLINGTLVRAQQHGTDEKGRNSNQAIGLLARRLDHQSHLIELRPTNILPSTWRPGER